ncbi:MAG: hypothetical protein E6Q57_13430, partial [Mycobacterium sp.]
MAGGDKHSKTEAPTQKRKKEARKDGQVIRSEDFVTWASVLVATMVMPMLVRNGSNAARDALAMMLQVARRPDEGVLVSSVGEVMTSPTELTSTPSSGRRATCNIIASASRAAL